MNLGWVEKEGRVRGNLVLWEKKGGGKGESRLGGEGGKGESRLGGEGGKGESRLTGKA